MRERERYFLNRHLCIAHFCIITNRLIHKNSNELMQIEFLSKMTSFKRLVVPLKNERNPLVSYFNFSKKKILIAFFSFKFKVYSDLSEKSF